MVLALCDYIKAAQGIVKADLVVKDARVVNVNTREIYSSDIAIEKERIVLVGDASQLVGHNTSVIDARGLYAVPSFIDAHIHVESSMITPTEFCRVAASHGTSAIVWDPHEIVNVVGNEGLEIAVEETSRLPLHVFFVVPSCVPSAPRRETSAACLNAQQIRKALRLRNVIGLGEVMDYPGVLSCSSQVLRKLEKARGMHSIIDGHAPRVTGKELCAYAASGVRSDHEAASEEEGLERLRLGMWLMIRESSTSKDLSKLIGPLVKGSVEIRHCMFVSDDRSVSDLLTEGHMDHILRLAMSEGMDAMSAIQMATINPATYIGLEHEIGSIAPARFADILLLSDLNKVRIERIIIGGKEIERYPKAKKFRYPTKFTQTVKLRRKLNSSDLVFEALREKEVSVTVVKLLQETLLTEKETKRLKIRGGAVELSDDVLYAAVVERHGRNGNIGRGFVAGLGSLDGALAQTIAHDSHNLIIIGSNPSDMLASAERVAAMDGGVALSSRGKTVASLALSIGGLMSTERAESVAKEKESLEDQGRELGLKVKSPVTMLSFLSLPVIPTVRLTDKGLFDVERGVFIDPFLTREFV
jgi:adenine deaminase